MQYRCINAFAFGGRTIAGGALVDGDDPIVGTHAAHFAAVQESSRSTETADAVAPRTPTKSVQKKTSKASTKP